jgi:hypothetical protein
MQQEKTTSSLRYPRYSTVALTVVECEMVPDCAVGCGPLQRRVAELKYSWPARDAKAIPATARRKAHR